MQKKSIEKNSLIYSIKVFIIAVAFIFSISTNFLGATIYNNIVLVLMLISVMLHCLRREVLFVRIRILALMTVLVILLVYNFLLHPLESQKLLIHLSCFLIGYVTADVDDEGERNYVLKRVMISYMTILVVTAVIGMFESITGNFLDSYTVRVYAATYRLHSVFLHPIIFALMMLQLFVLAHYYISNQIVRSLINFSAVYCIFLSLTRAAWVAFMIIYLLIMIQRKYIIKEPTLIGKLFTKKRILETSFVFMLLIIVLWKSDVGKYFTILFSRWNELEGSTSISYRSSTISTILDGIKHANIIQWIIGSGYLSAQSILENSGIYFGSIGNNVVDNQWLCVIADFGLLGLFGMLYFMIKSIRIFFIKTVGNDMWALSLCILCSLMIAFICDIFNWSTAGCITFIFFGLMFSNLKYVCLRRKP